MENSTEHVKSIREQIFAAKDIKEEIVDVPEWGVKIKLKSLTGEQGKDAWRKTPKNADGDINNVEYGYFLFIKSAHDVKTDRPLFGDEDLPRLMTKNLGVLARLSQKVTAISGLDLEAVEKAEKN